MERRPNVVDQILDVEDEIFEAGPASVVLVHNCHCSCFNVLKGNKRERKKIVFEHVISCL